MRKFLISVVIILSGVLGYLYFSKATPITTTQYLATPTPLSNKPEKDRATLLIEEVNELNSRIDSFYCENMDIRIRKDITYRLSGFMAYKKPVFFRTHNYSVLGQETDIGSNERLFWFWSRRMTPPALHFSSHEDVQKTRLKTPFNPKWMMESLSMNQIDLKNVEIVKNGSNIAVLQQRISTLNRPVLKITLVNPKTKTIIGHYIVENDQVVVSTEIESFQTVDGHRVPKVVNIIWFREGIAIRWEFNNPKVNQSIAPSMWEMPNMRSKINMGEEQGNTFLVMRLIQTSDAK